MEKKRRYFGNGENEEKLVFQQRGKWGRVSVSAMGKMGKNLVFQQQQKLVFQQWSKLVFQQQEKEMLLLKRNRKNVADG